MTCSMSIFFSENTDEPEFLNALEARGGEGPGHHHSVGYSMCN